VLELPADGTQDEVEPCKDFRAANDYDCLILREVVRMEISISTIAYDLHQPTEPRLRDFRAAGFTTIDWTEQYATIVACTESDAVNALTLCEQLGLRIATMHGATHLSMPYKGDAQGRDRLWLELNRANIDFISRVGGDCVVLHLPGTSVGSDRDRIRDSKRLLDDLRPHAERHGVRLALENSPGGSGPGDYWPANRDIIGELLRAYPADYLGWCFDAGHANLRNDTDMLRLYPQRLIATHLHDNNGLSDQHLLPGQGSVDWKSIVSALKDAGYGGPLNLEVEKPEGVDRAAWCAEAFDRIRRVWEFSSTTDWRDSQDVDSAHLPAPG